MAYIRFRLHPPARSISAKDGFFRTSLVSDGYFIDELSIQDGERYEYPRSATVVFDETLSDSKARLEYDPSWKDPDTGEIQEGLLNLYLPLTPAIDAYIRGHDFAERHIILSAHIESNVDNKLAMFYMGPDGEGEYHWDFSIAAQLKASIQWMAPDQVFRSEPIKEHAEQPVLEPLPWQRQAIEMHFEAMHAQRTSLIEIEKVLRRICSVLVAIAAVAIIYGIAKAV